MDSVFERVMYVVKKSGKTKNAILKDLEFNHNFFVDLEKKEQMPSAEKIIKLAQYFSVTADYLLGLSDADSAEQDLQLYYKLSPEQQQKILKEIQALYALQENKQKTQQKQNSI